MGASWNIPSAPQGKLPRKKRHGVRLAVARRLEISATLAVFLLHRFYDALAEQSGGEELRIPADNLHFVAVVLAILKVVRYGFSARSLRLLFFGCLLTGLGFFRESRIDATSCWSWR